MKKTNKTLYALMFVTGSSLVPYGTVNAARGSEWECTPSADFRSWNCLKDGKAPVEKAPKPVASQPIPEAVKVSPLAAPETINPEPGSTPIVTEKPMEAPEPAPIVIEKPTEAPGPAPIVVEKPTEAPVPAPIVAEKPTEAPEPAPIVVEKPTEAPEPAPIVAEKPTEAPVPAPMVAEKPMEAPEPAPIVVEKPTEAPEPAPVVTEKPTEAPEPAPIVVEKPTEAPEPAPVVVEKPTEAPEPAPVVVEKPTEAPEPAPVVVEQSTASPESTAEPATVADKAPGSESKPEPVTKLVDNYAPIESSLISVDETLRSCVSVNRPSSLNSTDRQKLRDESPTEIEADNAQIEKNKKTILSGNVTISRADQSLKSEQIILNKETNQVDAEGRVNYTDSKIQIRSEQAHLDLDKDENSFAEASFITLDRYSRGSAGQIQTQQGKKVHLDKVSYTTCPPNNTTWQLKADEITLNDETGRGDATHVKLEIMDIPVFYLPYMHFPIDDRRQTGFLTPRISNSDDRGFEITTPIYWNIAPDQDATFYPRYMTERGLQLGGEYRYLNNEYNYGRVNFEYLNDDDKYVGHGDNDRWALKFEHDGNFWNDQWSFGTRIRRVSDDQYFEDLGSSLSLSSTTYLHNYFYLGRGGNNWSFSGLAQGFQVVDSTIPDASEPYKYKPQLNFNYWTDPFAGNFTARLETTYTNIGHKSSARVSGKRTSIYPSITYNYDKGGYYIRPKFGVHYTHYSLKNEGTLSSSPSRSVPIFSIDSGLFYEKDTSLFGKAMLQTLEPRIYYLNVAERNQTNIPVFDSGLYDFSTSALFRENRFGGQDRIGDTNQLSISLTSQLLDANDGSEKLSASLGQIYYFSDRNVTLPGGKKDDDHSSPIIAELSFNPYRELAASAQVHWDPEKSKTDRMLYRVKYQPEDDKIINLAYRFREGNLKQTDASFLWPIDDSKRWHAIGRWNYSLRDNKTLDSLGGIEYESCCWKTRFVVRRSANDITSNPFINNGNVEYDLAVFFELELKGLGSFGDDVTGFLEDGILGYDRHLNDNDNDKYYY